MRPLYRAVLETLQESPGGLTVENLAQELQLQGRKTGEHANSVRSIVASLRSEGVVNQIGPGRYDLARVHHEPTQEQARTASILQEVLTPSGLAMTVIWDATPYLALSEDGPPGTRVVVEGKDADAVYWTVLAKWQESNWVARWGHKGPIGHLLWGTDEYRLKTQTGFFFLHKDRIGGTALTDAGYRVPYKERITLEFLDKRMDPDVANAILSHLVTKDFDVDLAWKSAKALGVQNYLTGYLAAKYHTLPKGVANQFLGLMPSVLKVVLE